MNTRSLLFIILISTILNLVKANSGNEKSFRLKNNTQKNQTDRKPKIPRISEKSKNFSFLNFQNNYLQSLKCARNILKIGTSKDVRKTEQ